LDNKKCKYFSNRAQRISLKKRLKKQYSFGMTQGATENKSKAGMQCAARTKRGQ